MRTSLSRSILVAAAFAPLFSSASARAAEAVFGFAEAPLASASPSGSFAPCRAPVTEDSFAFAPGVLSDDGPIDGEGCDPQPIVEPSELVIDATGGNVEFPLPDAPRSFDTFYDFVAFAQTELGAEPIFDEYGNLVGVSGRVLELGDTYFTDPATGEAQAVDDPIAAYLGGPTGSLTIEGAEVSFAPQGALVEARAAGSDVASFAYGGATALTLPYQSSRTACNAAGTECIQGESWNSHTNIWFYHYASAGSKTTQVRGGYQESLGVCWKWGFIPYPCIRSSGSNQLFVKGMIFGNAFPYVQPPNPTLILQSPILSATNATSVTYREYRLYLGNAPELYKPTVENAIGACGAHWSAAVSAKFTTGADTYSSYTCGAL